MNLLFVIEGHGIGGNEVLLANLSRDLTRHKLHSIVACPTGLARNFIRSAGTKVVTPSKTVKGWKRLLMSNEIALTIVIHGPILGAALVSKSLGIPVLWIYGHPYYLNGWSENEATVASVLVDRIVAQSKFLASTLACVKEKTKVIPNGVNLSHFYPLSHFERMRIRKRLGVAKDRILIGYPARFVPYKRHAFLKQVVERLRTRVPNVTLLLIGAPDTMSAQHILAVRAHPSEMRKLLGACDLAVFPAAEEGYGCAVAEALALGVPTLINRQGGHTEFSSVGKSFFFTDGGVESLSSRIEDVLVRDGLRKRMSKRAMAYARQLDSRRTTEKYVQLIGRLLIPKFG